MIFFLPPFDDRRVRLAFAQAANREALADVALRGLLSPAAGSLVPPGIPGHSKKIVLPRDPDGARRLHAEAGFPAGKGFPALRMAASIGGQEAAAGTALCSQWQETLGVHVTVQELLRKDDVTRLGHDPPRLGFAGWTADYPDPYNFLYMPGISWWFGDPWRNERYDRLVQSARRTTDLKLGLGHFREAEAILSQEVPLFPELHGRMRFLRKPWISSFPTSPIKYRFFKDVVFDPH